MSISPLRWAFALRPLAYVAGRVGQEMDAMSPSRRSVSFGRCSQTAIG